VRIVLDANVLLAAFGARGMCASLLEVCLDQHELISSDHILEECRRHLIGKFKMPADHADEIIIFLREHTDVVEPTPVDAVSCGDPEDLPVLGTAIAGQAEVIVSGDRHLLELSEHADIPIVTPRACYERLR
jgi:putative PIN family toxin of toxin-antitoxin system